MNECSLLLPSAQNEWLFILQVLQIRVLLIKSLCTHSIYSDSYSCHPCGDQAYHLKLTRKVQVKHWTCSLEHFSFFCTAVVNSVLLCLPLHGRCTLYRQLQCFSNALLSFYPQPPTSSFVWEKNPKQSKSQPFSKLCSCFILRAVSARRITLLSLFF